MNTVGYFEIQSSNPARELEFYKNVFGWRFFKEEHLPIEYYRIQTNSINGGLLKRPAEVPPMQTGTNAFCCSIQVENFDTTADLILKNGGQVALPKNLQFQEDVGRATSSMLIIMFSEFLKLMKMQNR